MKERRKGGKEERKRRWCAGRRAAFGALVLSALALAAPAGVWGQGRYEDLAVQYDRARLYHEAFALPGDVRPALVVSFRIPNAMLVFVQAPLGSPEGAFVAEAEVAVAVYRGEALVEERRWRRTQHAADFEATQSRTSDVEGLVTFGLDPGFYTYRLVVQDGHSERSRALERYPVEVPDFGGGAAGRPVTATDVAADGPDVRLGLVNLGGDAPFGRTSEVVVPLGLPPDVRLEGVTLTYTFFERLEEEDGRPGGAPPVRRASDGTVLPPLDVVRKGPAVLVGAVEGAVFVPVPAATAGHEGGRLAWPATSVPDTAGALARIPLDGEGWAEGAYVLEMELRDASGKRIARRQAPLEVRWHGKPVSLYSPAVAIRNLQFIESRAAVRAMLRGGAEAQRAKLDAYWKRLDPTPETRVNELMAEYYRRVDHAADAFRTGTVPAPDGLQTDRARVYVVHGPPEAVERTFPPAGGVEETWTYGDGRTFAFRAATSFDAFEEL